MSRGIRCARCKAPLDARDGEELVVHDTGAIAHTRCLTARERAALAAANLFGPGTGKPPPNETA